MIPGKQQNRPIQNAVVRTATGKPRIRILLAEDHTLAAEALVKLLEPEFEVVGRVSDGRSLLESAPKLKPNVVILDLSMPLLNGMDAGPRLKKLLPDAKVVVLTASEDLDIVTDVLTWASGLLLKKSAGSELAEAVKKVLTGQPYVTTSVLQRIGEKGVEDARSKQTDSLTGRQRQVLQLLGEGCTMKEAANVLGLKARTVAFHKYRIMQQFGIKNNMELFRFAAKARVVPPLQ
jgi:DNA-binding NarL/FixJ family response regulator